MKYHIYLFTVVIVAISLHVRALDNPHFYRATNMFLETRLEHDYLTTFNATLGGGSTDKGRNCHNTIVPLFDIYGTNPIQELGASLINPDLNNPYNRILNDLMLLPTREGFATLSIEGKFNILEANVSLTQNLARGFLLFLHMPVRKLEIKNVCFTDLSPDDTIFPNKNTIEWQRFLQLFNPTLNNFGINTQATTSTGAGDLSAWLGWTNNYQETDTIDFIDTTLMAGFLAPTGKEKNQNKLFSLPTGYNGHWGFPLCAAFSLGFYEWVTLGAYVNVLFFLDKDQTMRVKTDPAQDGIIKLACADLSVHKGTLVNTGFYIKADHFAHGLSFTTAYSFAQQHHDHIKPKNCVDFDATILNSDSTLAGWNMHTINFVAEYDFTKEDSKVGNRIGLFYNLQVAGKRTWNTNIVGGSYGIDIGWFM